jgi:hypothetical protein
MKLIRDIQYYEIRTLRRDITGGAAAPGIEDNGYFINSRNGEITHQFYGVFLNRT